ncbi:hypothetical protein [Propionicicella superfundia]|uniref:hypothetical protein n=1 Tax=Propionicicella superfundia TaxID=348582 RepID=UPI0012EB2D62|nr:hypothetical protein [Propionicicella superfundia]
MNVLENLMPGLFSDIEDPQLRDSLEFFVATHVIAGYVGTARDAWLAKSYFMRDISDDEYVEGLSLNADAPPGNSLRAQLEELLSETELKEINAQRGISSRN